MSRARRAEKVGTEKDRKGSGKWVRHIWEQREREPVWGSQSFYMTSGRQEAEDIG